jgi:hypothetical protein
MVVSGVTVAGAAVGIVHSVVSLKRERREAKERAWREAMPEAIRNKVGLYQPSPGEIDRFLAEHRAYESRRSEQVSSSPISDPRDAPRVASPQPSRTVVDVVRELFEHESMWVRRIAYLSLVVIVALVFFAVSFAPR